MTDDAVTADQHELACCRAVPKRLQHPEHALDRNVHGGMRALLARGHMDDMGDIGHGTVDNKRVRDRAVHSLKAVAGGQGSVVAQGADMQIGPTGIVQQLIKQDSAYFPVAPVTRTSMWQPPYCRDVQIVRPA
ncbi:MAG: hypothetical protein MO852_00405 [Candidatus Devosia euplotis]|nr:hypothetical protein [Candidatus Devosia euplotis]